MAFSQVYVPGSLLSQGSQHGVCSPLPDTERGGAEQGGPLCRVFVGSPVGYPRLSRSPRLTTFGGRPARARLGEGRGRGTAPLKDPHARRPVGGRQRAAVGAGAVSGEGGEDWAAWRRARPRAAVC